MTFTVGSLFAGVGGVCLGFKQAEAHGKRFVIEWANEIDEYAAVTYRNNFEHNLIHGDINKVLNPSLIDIDIERIYKECEEIQDISEIEKKHQLVQKLREEKEAYKIKNQQILDSRIDVLLGGFPCQAFSIAGERKGFEDDRGNLFLSIVKLIEMLGELHGKPRILFLENVKNIKSHDGGNTYKVIKSKLEECGYTIKEHILNTMNYSNLPQNRERIYIIGFLNSEDADKFTLFDNLSEKIVNRTEEERIEAIRNIIDYTITYESNPKYYYTREKYPKYFVNEEEYNNIPQDQRRDIRINLTEQIDEMYEFYQLRRGMYVRKNQSGVCPTLTANMGTGGHNVPLILVNDGIRKITPAEAFRLQGFPVGDGYELPTEYSGRVFSDSHLYKQSGNAVSVPIIKLLAEAILNIL